MKQTGHKFKFALVLWLLCIGLPLCAHKAYTPEKVPNVQMLHAREYVSDPEHLLQNETVQELNDRLEAIRDSFDVEFVIVLLPSIGNRPIEDFGVELFRMWGLGNKERNTGLLLTIVTDIRKSRFDVGYGLEGDLPDATVFRLQQEYLNPHFRNGDYDGGVLAVVEAVQKKLNGTELKKQRTDGSLERIPLSAMLMLYVGFMSFVTLWLFILMMGNYNMVQRNQKTRAAAYNAFKEGRKGIPALFFIIFLPGALLLFFIHNLFLSKLRHGMTLCPQCGRHTVQPVHMTREVISTLSGGEILESHFGSRKHQIYACGSCNYREVTAVDYPASGFGICPQCQYRTLVNHPKTVMKNGRAYARAELTCQHCGYTENHDRPHPPSEGTSGDAVIGALLLAALGFGSFLGGRGGGGFGGGGFGGGSTGGGGATSGW